MEKLLLWILVYINGGMDLVMVESPPKRRLVKQPREEKYAAVESYVMEDRWGTARKVTEAFDLSYGTAQEALTSKLELKWVSARCVLHLLQFVAILPVDMQKEMGIWIK